jgi:hypothetical protein
MVVPLAFCVVTARLSAANTSLTVDDSDSVCSNQRDLSVLMETIKSFFPQYDGVDLIKETVKHAADLAHTASQNLPDDSAMPPTSWTQILIDNPELYLKMVMSIDLSINKGRLAEEEDFPTGLFSTMRIDETPDHTWVSRQALESAISSDLTGPEMGSCTASSWETEPSTFSQCGNTPLSANKIKGSGTNQVDMQMAEPAWEGSVSLDSIIAESLWGNESVYATDQFSETIETWAEMPHTDLHLAGSAWE